LAQAGSRVIALLIPNLSTR